MALTDKDDRALIYVRSRWPREAKKYGDGILVPAYRLWQSLDSMTFEDCCKRMIAGLGPEH